MSAATTDYFEQLLSGRPVLYGPDREIMEEHRIPPRTAREEEALAAIADPADVTVAHARLEAVLESAMEVLQQICVAPGAKWGDLTVGIYSRAGDLALASTRGVNMFSAAVSPVPKFIGKHWADEPTVGVRPGDVFFHNDSTYGGTHNPDHTVLIPLFWEDEHVAWIGTVMHEGDNGALDPGGFAPSATTRFGEGLRIAPMKIGENHVLRRDVLNMFQNQVRDPLAWLVDTRAKHSAVRDVEQRLHDLMREHSPELLIATLRHLLESTEAEVAKRVAAWPDGRFRSVCFGDTTLHEERLFKLAVEIEKRGSRLTVRTHGSAPQIDRAINAQAHYVRSIVGNEFMAFLFADLPRNAGFVSALEFDFEPGSMLAADDDQPTSLSMLSSFAMNTALHVALTKALFANPGQTVPIAPWYAMIPTLRMAGLNQHGQLLARSAVEMNAAGGGARHDRDGEHACAPFFATLADWGEMEEREAEFPVVGLWRRIPEDNHGFGRHRGGASVEWAYMLYGSRRFVFAETSTGGRFPVTGGLFGGYGGPCTPLTRVRPRNGFEDVRAWLAAGAEGLSYDAAKVVERRPIDADYTVSRPDVIPAPVVEGEFWIQRMGGGGGYGDPLEREPEEVAVDLRRGLISPEVASSVYKLVWNGDRCTPDLDATAAARDAERRARLERGLPYDAFVAAWRRDAPPAEVPYLGSWEWEAPAEWASESESEEAA
ncbi:hydantoinase B/oxoprolinase family protein [Conexibacter arvalis]|uniref:N-methylhydantoinase B/oxoprolinase/acetone carboxylase alpha subunit n=1 Tax=Conexibacter arvalis TaxID=912552 RepID=A0A840I9M6_9ACTN|nr:hydantoinase B/oxoprolinase family protein [Conexibacter arvalis]MBB4660630.1 N-methylhydantoinase B/oxoprolinase/acetone carboxylase alpha subunit [Conexibacter arvalis]